MLTYRCRCQLQVIRQCWIKNQIILNCIFLFLFTTFIAEYFSVMKTKYVFLQWSTRKCFILLLFCLYFLQVNFFYFCAVMFCSIPENKITLMKRENRMTVEVRETICLVIKHRVMQNRILLLLRRVYNGACAG